MSNTNVNSNQKKELDKVNFFCYNKTTEIESMNDQKNLMAEIALLYYKKGLTQQEIANALQLTRQTVSKLLASAVDEKIVEIIIHNPKAEREDLERKLKERYGVKAVVCGASRNSDELRQLVTTEGAIHHLLPILSEGNLRIAVSWGRSVQNVIKAFPTTPTKGNVVFPLFGATEHEQTYFLPNELAREFSAKLEADVKFAWFPYKPENERDFDLFKRTDYYRQMQCDWERLDVAIIGIGNNHIVSGGIGLTDLHNKGIGGGRCGGGRHGDCRRGGGSGVALSGQAHDQHSQQDTHNKTHGHHYDQQSDGVLFSILRTALGALGRTLRQQSIAFFAVHFIPLSPKMGK
jgi:DNA-binding transcriptional regulator LsrR (DeoR family)